MRLANENALDFESGDLVSGVFVTLLITLKV